MRLLTNCALPEQLPDMRLVDHPAYPGAADVWSLVDTEVSVVKDVVLAEVESSK